MIFSVNRGNLLFVCWELKGKGKNILFEGFSLLLESGNVFYFFVSLDLRVKEKRDIACGILNATGEGRRILHNDKLKTELTQISSLRKQTNSKLVNLKLQTR